WPRSRPCSTARTPRPPSTSWAAPPCPRTTRGSGCGTACSWRTRWRRRAGPMPPAPPCSSSPPRFPRAEGSSSAWPARPRPPVRPSGRASARLFRPLELALFQGHEAVVDDPGLALAQELAHQRRLDREQAVQPGQVARDLAAHDVAPQGERVQLARRVHGDTFEERGLLVQRARERPLEEVRGLLAQLVAHELEEEPVELVEALDLAAHGRAAHALGVGLGLVAALGGGVLGHAVEHARRPQAPDGAADLEVRLARRRADLLEAHHAVHGGDEIHLLLVEAHVAHGAGGVRGQAVLLAEAAHRAPDARPAL